MTLLLAEVTGAADHTVMLSFECDNLILHPVVCTHTHTCIFVLLLVQSRTRHHKQLLAPLQWLPVALTKKYIEMNNDC